MLFRSTSMKPLHHYFANLRAGKIVLWCYLIWYLVMAYCYFDARPSLWINSLGISAVIGTGLVLSVMPAGGLRAMDRWAVARLYMMPIGVSSFAALIKDHNFMVIFSPRAADNLIAAAACAVFVAGVSACKLLSNKSDT